MDYGRRELADALAAQYAAGLLRGRARRRFEALLPSHPMLRDAVRDWQHRLMPLAEVVAPVPPPPAVWAGIERRLWPRAAAPRPLPWWQRLAVWRMTSALAAVVVLGLVVLLANPPPQGAPVVIVLQGTGDGGSASGAASLVASFSRDGRAAVMRPLQPVALAPDRVLELWAVPPQGAPRSLGLISRDAPTVLRRERLPKALLERANTAAFAVSLEPPGGSPTGVPTGPVVYAGPLPS